LRRDKRRSRGNLVFGLCMKDTNEAHSKEYDLARLCFQIRTDPRNGLGGKRRGGHSQKKKKKAKKKKQKKIKKRKRKKSTARPGLASAPKKITLREEQSAIRLADLLDRGKGRGKGSAERVASTTIFHQIEGG